jgi:hypothetical protein
MSRTRLLAAAAMTAAAGLLLSACADMPQPSRPELTPSERPAVRQGEASQFLTTYASELDAALGEDPEALEPLQANPLLERTTAEMRIAQATDRSLGAVGYTDVVAGGPVVDGYPLWYMAFATPDQAPPSGDDEESAAPADEVQALLVRRDSAAEDWKVVESIFVPADAQPTILADESGAVETAPEAHTEAAARVTEQAAEYLQTGEVPDGAPAFPDAGFQDFRDYIDELGAEDTGFSDVGAECAPDTEAGVADYALATEGGGVSFAEIRCTITVNVPESYFVDLGEDIDAVMSTDDEGSTITITVGQPLLATTQGEEISVYSPGWFMLESATSGQAAEDSGDSGDAEG